MKELICIACPKGCHLKVDDANGYTVTGNGCENGVEYGRHELTNPTRVITSTVRCKGGIYPRLPVKTDREIPKGLIFDAMRVLDGVEVEAPVMVGDIIVENVLGTGVNFVASRNI